MSDEVAANQPTPLTQEGVVQLEVELQYLRSTRRREVALRIKRAAELGDRSENSEYEDAKNEQAFVEGRIRELERLLRHVKVIDAAAHSAGVVSLGSTVDVIDAATGERSTYTIVGPVETDPAQGRISHQSPIGAALIGCARGDTVCVDTPAGTVNLQVSRIR